MNNIVDEAHQAWVDHLMEPKAREALRVLDLDFDHMLAFEAMWKLHWIRKQYEIRHLSRRRRRTTNARDTHGSRSNQKKGAQTEDNAGSKPKGL